MRSARLSLGLLIVAAAAAPAGEPTGPARATSGLHTYVSNADYPAAALRRHEEGTVVFRLDVGVDGLPTACTVTGSSGSAALDETTCRIMRERARFTPARDAEGRPVPDRVTSRIVWKIGEEAEGEIVPGSGTAMNLWASCVVGEAAKLAPGDVPPEEVAERAFPPCAPLERLAAERAALDRPRFELAQLVERMVGAWRARLAAAAADAPPER